MACPLCEEPTVVVDVPPRLVEYAPGERIAVCTRCLTLDATDEPAEGESLDAVSEHLPSGDGGLATLLMVDLLASLATNRESIEALIGILEGDGVDPLLVLDRLAEDPSVEPAIELPRRRRQLEQLVL